MKIILFASPEFAIPTLDILYNSSHKILAVYTKSPKEQGRGMKLQNTPIYNVSEKLSLSVFTPKSLKKPEEWEQLKNFGADIFVVVAYGLILPKEILNIARFGCINIHPSLLPRWRGASPIQRAMLAGDKETGVCIIQLGEGLDDGDILDCKKVPITSETTFSSLHDELSQIGAKLLLKSLDDIEKNSKIIATPQATQGITYAEKITNGEGKIDFNNSVEQIDLQIRTLGEFIGTYFEHNNERIKILKANIVKSLTNEQSKMNNGTLFIDDGLNIKCNDGLLKPLVLQREGRKPMVVSEFVKGFRL